jgi:hypothetical protein
LFGAFEMRQRLLSGKARAPFKKERPSRHDGNPKFDILAIGDKKVAVICMEEANGSLGRLLLA